MGVLGNGDPGASWPRVPLETTEFATDSVRTPTPGVGEGHQIDGDLTKGGGGEGGWTGGLEVSKPCGDSERTVGDTS